MPVWFRALRAYKGILNGKQQIAKDLGSGNNKKKRALELKDVWAMRDWFLGGVSDYLASFVVLKKTEICFGWFIVREKHRFD